MRPKSIDTRYCQCGCGRQVHKRRVAVDFREEDRGYETPCWIWLKFINDSGYGLRHASKGVKCLAHRAYYEIHVGPIPGGLEIDHLCRVRACVNPAHLEPVTRKVNVHRGESSAAYYARRTHCEHGHPFSGDNLAIDTRSGARRCRACGREAYRRKKGA